MVHFIKYLKFENIYSGKPNVEPHPNLIEKFEPESNLKVAEPKPCDIALHSHARKTTAHT